MILIRKAAATAVLVMVAGGSASWPARCVSGPRRRRYRRRELGSRRHAPRHACRARRVRRFLPLSPQRAKRIADADLDLEWPELEESRGT